MAMEEQNKEDVAASATTAVGEEVTWWKRAVERVEHVELGVWLSSCLLLAAVAAAVIPSLSFLVCARSFLLDTPVPFTVVSTLFYIVKTVLVCVATVCAVVIYSDVVFPLVMNCFALVLTHTTLPASVYTQPPAVSDISRVSAHSPH